MNVDLLICSTSSVLSFDMVVLPVSYSKNYRLVIVNYG